MNAIVKKIKVNWRKMPEIIEAREVYHYLTFSMHGV